jgi:RND family efflux transporter MFP subunit
VFLDPAQLLQFLHLAAHGLARNAAVVGYRLHVDGVRVRIDDTAVHELPIGQVADPSLGQRSRANDGEHEHPVEVPAELLAQRDEQLGEVLDVHRPDLPEVPGQVIVAEVHAQQPRQHPIGAPILGDGRVAGKAGAIQTRLASNQEARVHKHGRSIRAAAMVLLAVTAGLAGCNEPAPPPPPAEVSRPVPILEIASTTAASGLRFPGRIWDKSQAVPRAEVDRKRTAMEVARSRFAAAQKELNDTRLTAPFAGIVARRLVESFQNVQAKEPVVSLQSPDQLEIVIHVPERVVRVEPRRLAGFAVFDDLPERRFPVTLKSFATEADAQTQTYEAVLGLPRPDDLRVLPGMAVEVLPDGAGVEADGEAPVLIPLAAVAAAADGAPSVWVVEPDTGRVSRRVIETGAVQGGDVLVLTGLAAGEQIVTAGVHQLREGMRVHPLAAGL